MFETICSRRPLGVNFPPQGFITSNQPSLLCDTDEELTQLDMLMAATNTNNYSMVDPEYFETLSPYTREEVAREAT